MLTAVQLTGLGGYMPGILRQWATSETHVSEILAQIDQAAREYGIPPVSVPLADPDGPSAEELATTPTRLHLAAMASGLALYGALAAQLPGRHVLVGHSTGELAVLAAAGCLSVYDAARVVCEREVALASGNYAGGLTALRIGARRAEHLCGAVGGWTLQPSLFNAPRQTVVSGDAEELPRLEKAARALGIQVTRLLVIYPHHNPVLAEAAEQLAKATEKYRVGAPRMRVFSPLLGRPVRSGADARCVITRHLTGSVDYLGAIRELHANHGVDAFVEAGPRPVLTDCAGETLPAGVALVGPPRGAREAAEILDFLVGGQQDRRPRPSSVVPGDTHPAEGNGHPVRVSPRIEQDREPDVEVGDPVPPQESVPAARLPDRSVLLDELRAIFGEQLAYPDEVLTEDAHLEADLGIASVKKVELLIMLLDRYGLPTPPAELRLRDYNTLGKLIDLMVLLGAGGSGAAMAAD